jgi:hydroxypyruvate reductase
MPNLTQLRIAAREIFAEALSAVDAGAAVRAAVRLDGSELKVVDATIDLSNRKVYSVAIGKAAFPMAFALEDALGERFTAGLITGLYANQHQEPLDGKVQRKVTTHWRWLEGGHPLPNRASLLAASEALALLRRANDESSLVIFLISGGGSAMIELPTSTDITLENLRIANKALVGCGASISEINAVRRSFSAVKGGRLAESAQNCDQITLIVSDVPQGEERNVASGPTLAPLRNAPNPREVIERYDLRAQLPEAILHAIEADSPPSEDVPTSLRQHFVLLDNDSALEAVTEAARRRGFVTETANDVADQPIQEGCAQLLNRFEALQAKVSNGEPVCLISGGEFGCKVRGDGLGGRNLETALRLAQGRGSSSSEQFVALCAGTDGIDGNSPAAGAIVDSTTIDRAESIGLDPADFIGRSDAYSFFVALGDVVATGATGTNVRDIRILLGTRSD